MVVILVDKDFHTLYESVVLYIVNRSGEIIQTRDRKMDGRHVTKVDIVLVNY